MNKNHPSEKIVNDWSNDHNQNPQNIRKVASIKNPNVTPFTSADQILGIKDVKPVRTHLDPDVIDSKAILFAKKALKLRVHLPLKQQQALIFLMLGERSNVNAALFELIDDAGNAIFSHKKSNPIDGDMTRLGYARDDAIELFPGQSEG